MRRILPGGFEHRRIEFDEQGNISKRATSVHPGEQCQFMPSVSILMTSGPTLALLRRASTVFVRTISVRSRNCRMLENVKCSSPSVLKSQYTV